MIPLSAWIEVDAAALRSNLEFLGCLHGRGGFAPVLKGNAYGHGLAAVVEVLKKTTIPRICVGPVLDGVEARRAGFGGEIIALFPPLSREEIELAAQSGVETILTSLDALAQWRSSPRRPRTHLFLDTGHGRDGLRWDELDRLEELTDPERALVAGIASHCAMDGSARSPYSALQKARFDRMLARLKPVFPRAKAHFAASAAAALMPDARYDFCRIGDSFYGIDRSSEWALDWRTEPALSVKARVRDVRTFKPGEYLGYDTGYRASRRLEVGILGVGYADGLGLAESGEARALIGGRRAPIIKTAAMNATFVDVTGLSVRPGDVATLVGFDAGDGISLREASAWAGVSTNKFLTGLGASLPRLVPERS